MCAENAIVKRVKNTGGDVNGADCTLSGMSLGLDILDGECGGVMSGFPCGDQAVGGINETVLVLGNGVEEADRSEWRLLWKWRQSCGMESWPGCCGKS